jgi:hypothetical protein
VVRIPSHLLLSLPHLNLDFTTIDAAEIEMEIHDSHGMHIAPVTLEQAEEIARRAVRAWDEDILRGKLSDIPLDWWCT